MPQVPGRRILESPLRPAGPEICLTLVREVRLGLISCATRTVQSQTAQKGTETDDTALRLGSKGEKEIEQERKIRSICMSYK